MASKGQRWLVDSGILRKKNGDEEPQELLVFGYSCKLFRDDEKAKMIDQGKHLIPWMGDSTLKIDRYDGRGALADLRVHEPPSGGYDQRISLTEDEIRVEQLCDEERFRSLYNNDMEEATYHEEEMKRLHQALGSENTYGQVAYSYNDDGDSQKGLNEDTQSPKPSDGSQDDDDQAFIAPPELEVPDTMILPETQKLNAIITKTALFISRQGGQMEILIKAKQSNNPQFSFLSIDGTLHPYYRLVLEAIKSGKYNPEKEPDKEESESAEESDEDDEPYLHPSLASSLTKVEAAPSIPSIQYKPSADCAYSMLVNKITGKPPPPKGPPPLPLSDVAQPRPVQQSGYYPPPYPPAQNYAPAYPPAPQQYSHGPVIYSGGTVQSSPARQQTQTQPPISQSSTIIDDRSPNSSPKENPPSLVPYGPTPPKPLNRPSFIVPPADVQIIIDKMASYVAKNGRDFETIVKNKGDPRFNFLELSHQYHGYYVHKLTINEGPINNKVMTDEKLLIKQQPQHEKQKKLDELKKKQQRMEEVQKRVKLIQAKKKIDTNNDENVKQITTVSFSIKKPKDVDSTIIEKRSALEESTDEDEDVIDETQQHHHHHDDDVDEKKHMNVGKSTSPQSTNNDDDSTLNIAKIDNKSSKLQKSKKIQPQELVDLTDDILEDCQKEIRCRQAVENRIKDKLAAAAREKIVANTRERQLQLERKKKAAMFLSQIVQTPILQKINLETRIDDDVDSDEVRSLPSPSRDEISAVGGVVVQSSTKIHENSLMNRLKSADLSGKRSRPRSRSRSGSRGCEINDRQKIHKKHKKKKSSRKSGYDSPASSRFHKSKKSRKSSTRHRSRSRTPERRYQSSSRRTRTSHDSTSSDSSGTR